jgi:hypothetical protein
VKPGQDARAIEQGADARGAQRQLSAKAIIALGAFGQLSSRRGDTALAAEYRTLAEQFATRWATEADVGDHFRLAFDQAAEAVDQRAADQPDTWSQKSGALGRGQRLLVPSRARRGWSAPGRSPTRLR